jgi:hypothetical protein
MLENVLADDDIEAISLERVSLKVAEDALIEIGMLA